MELGDDALVRRAQGGDLEAFDALMRRYERLVCSIAMGHGAGREDGLDVTQNVFVKVWTHIDDVKDDGMFKPWLLRIAYNESVSWWRRRRRVDSREAAGDHLDLVEAEATSPDERIDDERVRRQVARTLAGLGPKYRTALSLRYAEGLRVREIAETMSCSEGMVKSLLFRGVRQLRERLG